jgi:hypothetical protein
LEFALILKHVKFPVNFYFSLDLNYSEDLELIAEIFSKEMGRREGKERRKPCSKNGHSLTDRMGSKKGERD